MGLCFPQTFERARDRSRDYIHNVRRPPVMSFDVIHAHTGRISVADGSELGAAAAAAFGVAPEAQIILAGTPKAPVAAVDWLDVAAPSCIPQFLWRVIENNAPSQIAGQPPLAQALTGTQNANPIAFVFDKGVIARVLEGSHVALVPPLQPVERHLPETPPSPLMGGSNEDRRRQLLRSRCRALSEQVYCAVECSRERLTSVELAAQVRWGEGCREGRGIASPQALFFAGCWQAACSSGMCCGADAPSRR